MVPSRWDAYANALAHGWKGGWRISWNCERCGGIEFKVHGRHKEAENLNGDLLITTMQFVTCLDCGLFEASEIKSIIPCWQTVPHLEHLRGGPGPADMIEWMA